MVLRLDRRKKITEPDLMAKTKVLICPYCGEAQTVGERCVACGGLFEPLSRQATHNAMGPWFVRNPMRPFQPGCSYETLVKMVERGQVIKTSIVRGPTSKQFWTAARRLPGIAHLLGYCHNCDASVDPGDHGCHSCGVPFGAYLDRNFLGLPEVKPLPWEAPLVDDRGAITGGRGIDWQRAAEPMGLSSFASDRELRGTGFTPAAAGVAGSPVVGDQGDGPRSGGGLGSGAGYQTTAMMERVSVAAASSAATAVESATSGAALRALQRRMQQQRNTIRLLTVGMIALAALAIVAVAMRLASGGAADGNQPHPQPKTAATSRTSPPAATPPASAPATSPQVDVREEMRRAEEVMADAARADRPVAQRIADYERAQQMLKDLAAKVPKDQQPAELNAHLQKIAREIEQLKLQQFFP